MMSYENAPSWWWSEPNRTVVGWSQPPRPMDVIASFNPHASKRDQARAVLYDYFHDDELRSWADNEAVKRCFIGGSDPRKEDHDPALLIAAYENRKHHVWQCHGDKMTWKDMNDAVQAAMKRRRKLGPLPKSSYDISGGKPLVIYYYDGTKMKKITYPPMVVPEALQAGNNRWWTWGRGDGSDAGKKAGLDDIHTFETEDPAKIDAERRAPGPGRKSEGGIGGGDWDSEGFNWDKDVAGTGVIASLTGAILALVSAVATATGVGAILGVPLAIATPFITAAINAADTALHAGDFGAALAQLGPALVQASMQAISKANINLPKEAVSALGSSMTSLAKIVASSQQKVGTDFQKLWTDVAKKAGGLKHIGDNEVHAIAAMLGGTGASHVFLQGYLAGKLTDAATIRQIAQIAKSMSLFQGGAIINLFLLGAGIGVISNKQSSGILTRGEFDEHFTGAQSANDELRAFVHFQLAPRYGLHVTSGAELDAYDATIARIQEHLNALGGFEFEEPECLPITGTMTERTRDLVRDFQLATDIDPNAPLTQTLVALEHALEQHWDMGMLGTTITSTQGNGDDRDWSALAHGCPHGYWWNSLEGACRVKEPLPLPTYPGGLSPLPNAPPRVQGEHVVSGDHHVYGPYTFDDAHAFLQRAIARGMTVMGPEEGPWHIDTHQHGVTFSAWRSGDGFVVVNIESKDFYVPTGRVWEKVDALMPAAHAVQGEWDVPIDTGMIDAELKGVVDNLAAQFLGQLGIVSIADAYGDDGWPYVLVLTSADPGAVEHLLPRELHGFNVVVEASEALMPYEEAYE